jgi:hypothetical protein
MKFRFWLCLWLINLAGCNLPPVAPPSTIFTQPVSPTLTPTITPFQTFTPSKPSKTIPIPATLVPLATDTRPDPVSSATKQVGLPVKGSNQGSVLLQNGLCCIGGVVGTNVNLRKDFFAPSSFGPVIEMRRMEGSYCLSEVQLANAPWEPFIPSVTESYNITAINWIGHTISVQYRDNLGNLSPVICDDISVEGMPAPPTSGL